jgi:hypothetical protein
MVPPEACRSQQAEDFEALVSECKDCIGSGDAYNGHGIRMEGSPRGPL